MAFASDVRRVDQLHETQCALWGPAGMPGMAGGTRVVFASTVPDSRWSVAPQVRIRARATHAETFTRDMLSSGLDRTVRR
jgi:hypothetical protein